MNLSSRINFFLVLLSLLYVSVDGVSQGYYPDASFAGNGRLVLDSIESDKVRETHFFDKDQYGRVVSVASELVSNSSATTMMIRVARFFPDGQPDQSFAGDGFLMFDVGTVEFGQHYLSYVTDIECHGSAIYLFGFCNHPTATNTWGDDYGPSKIFVVKLNADGSLDNSFAGNGVYVHNVNYARALCGRVLSNGKIAVGGRAGVSWEGSYALQNAYVLRLNSNGQLDNAFAQNGARKFQDWWNTSGYENIEAPIYGMHEQQNGKLILAGPNGFILRLDAGGAIDSSFIQQGFNSNVHSLYDVEYTHGGTVSCAPGNSPIAQYYRSHCESVAKFDLLVEDDTVFYIGNGGKHHPGINQSHWDETSRPTSFLRKYDNSGNLVTSFDNDGILNIDEHSVHGRYIDADGKLYLLGIPWDEKWDNLYLYRYTANGQNDSAWGDQGRVHVGRDSLIAKVANLPLSSICQSRLSEDFTLMLALTDMDSYSQYLSYTIKDYALYKYSLYPVHRVSICDGDSVAIGGLFQSSSGTYFHQGVERTEVTLLQVDSFQHTFIHGARCSGDAYVLNGDSLTQGGLYFDTISGGGCDTIVHLQLSFQDHFVDEQVVYECGIYSSSYNQGVNWDTITSNGCDTILKTTAHLQPASMSEFGSKRANVWYFGAQAGLDFNVDTVSTLSYGGVNNDYNSIICSEGGEFRFTFNKSAIERWCIRPAAGSGCSSGYIGSGSNEWNSNKMIIPVPGSSDTYFAFAAGDYYAYGTAFSSNTEDVLWCRLVTGGETPYVPNDPWGGLYFNNLKVTDYAVYEKMTAIDHPDGDKTWLIAPKRDFSEFCAFLIGKDGPGDVAFSPYVGPLASSQSRSQFKVSTDGRYLAYGARMGGVYYISLWDFDLYSGQLSNQRSIKVDSGVGSIYGLQFSPDARYLYAVRSSSSNATILQYDLTLKHADQIASSVVVLASGIPNLFGDLQLAPDGQIYVARNQQDYLGVISNPNNMGDSVHFELNGKYLGGQQSGRALPIFNQSYVAGAPQLGIAGRCLGESTLAYSTRTDALGYRWNFGDGAGFSGSSTIPYAEHQYAQPGNYSISLILEYMCLSDTLQIDILVDSTCFDLMLDSICSGDSTLFGNGYYFESGLYHDTLTNQSGGDSIVSLLLTVFGGDTTTINESLCYGDSIEILGNIYDSTGTYLQTMQSIHGCDSVIRIDIVEGSVQHDSMVVHICQGDSALIHGNYQTQAGVYTDTSTAAGGCDSVAVVSLIVHQIEYTSDSVTIYQGESYYVGGASQTTTGVYYNYDTTQHGCDSVTAILLWVIPVSNLYDTAHICDNESVEIGGTTYTTAGTHVDSVETSNQLTVHHTTIVVHPTYYLSDSVQINEGDSHYVGGAWQTTSGIYYDSDTTVYGCDSIEAVMLTVMTENEYAYDTVQLCVGDTIYLGGAYQSASGTYVDTITGGSSDTILTTTLIVLPNSQTNVSAIICANDSMYVGGAYQSTTGEYFDTLQAANGCDSVVVTALAVEDMYMTYDSTSICTGDSIFLGGAYRSTPGTYVDSMQSSSGCDSIVTTVLSIGTTGSFNAVLSNVTDVIKVNVAEGEFFWVDCDSGTVLQSNSRYYFDPGYAGNFAVVVDIDGCTDTSNCIYFEPLNKKGALQVSGYPTLVSNEYHIVFEVPQTEIQWNLYNLQGQAVMSRLEPDGRFVSVPVHRMAAGYYLLEVTTAEGYAALKFIKTLR